MKKKLLSLVVGGSLLIPTLGFAVGLGSVRTYSNLNERLSAEIPVLSVRKKGGMSVSLAPSSEFAKRGVQYSNVVNKLRFNLVEKRGRTYVRVSSAGKISVPYLNFILQLNTAEGVVNREYAIFLDPAGGKRIKRKTAKTTGAVTAKSGAVKVIPAKKAESQSKKATESKKTTPPPPQAAAVGKGGGQYGPVRRGETLWSIAKYTRPSEAISVREMVAAIKRANPRTLSRGLPAGAMLTIPTFKGHSAYKGGYAEIPTVEKKKAVTKKKTQEKKKHKPTRKTKIVQSIQPSKVVRPVEQTVSATKPTLPDTSTVATKINEAGQSAEKGINDVTQTIDSSISKATETVDTSVLKTTEEVPTTDMSVKPVEPIKLPDAEPIKTESVEAESVISSTEPVTTQVVKPITDSTPTIKPSESEPSASDTVSEPKSATEAVVKTAEKAAEKVVTTAETTKAEVAKKVEKTVSAVKKGGSEIPWLPIGLVGAAVVCAGGAFAVTRKKKKGTAADKVVLLDDESLNDDAIQDDMQFDTAAIGTEGGADVQDVAVAAVADSGAEVIDDITADVPSEKDFDEFQQFEQNVADDLDVTEEESLFAELDSEFDIDSKAVSDELSFEDSELGLDFDDIETGTTGAVANTTTAVETKVAEVSDDFDTLLDDTQMPESVDFNLDDFDAESAGVELASNVELPQADSFDLTDGEVDFDKELAEMDSLSDDLPNADLDLLSDSELSTDNLDKPAISTSEAVAGGAVAAAVGGTAAVFSDAKDKVTDGIDALGEFDLSDDDSAFDNEMSFDKELAELDAELSGDELSVAEKNEMLEFDLSETDEAVAPIAPPVEDIPARAPRDFEFEDQLAELDIEDDSTSDDVDAELESFEINPSDDLDFDLSIAEEIGFTEEELSIKSETEEAILDDNVTEFVSSSPEQSDLAEIDDNLDEGYDLSDELLFDETPSNKPEQVASADMPMVGPARALDLDDPAVLIGKELSKEDAAGVQIKLDLATSFVSIANTQRAKELLTEVVGEGTKEQVVQAAKLLKTLG